MSKINISPLKKAFLSLNKAVDRALLNRNDLELRDACIQRFEYTYELANKMIKRFIEEGQPSTAAIDQLTYRDLLRVAAEIGLIDSVEHWFKFRDARNKTSHAYDDAKALEVFEEIPTFILHTKKLIDNMDLKISRL